MVEARGVRVPEREAETTRLQLRAAGALRDDLQVSEAEGSIVFPVEVSEELEEALRDMPAAEPVEVFEFTPRARRPRNYMELLDWPEKDLHHAPRAYDRIGDIVVVKVPEALWDRRGHIGRALKAFHPGVRAVFHDAGVTGEHRTRRLEAIAGSGPTRTEVAENGVRLVVDPAKAYFSPRLAEERARIVQQLRPGDRVIDLFGGVAPFAVQAARAGAEVVCVDINPDATEMARENVGINNVDVEVVEGDSRKVAARLDPADHVVMNLPHGAKDFLDVATPLVKPGGVLHYHEILPAADVEARKASLVAELSVHGRKAEVLAVRQVRAYSARDVHAAFDVRLA